MKKGLVLGGGIGYGFAHIGALKVLEAAGLKFDVVAGTSVGSLIGALYASGKKAQEIEKLALELKWQDLLTLVIPKEGLVSLENLENFVNRNCRVKNIEELRSEFVAVATNLCDSSPFVFRKGPISKAVRASCSIPGIFTPLHYEGGILVDGGVVDNLPVEPAKEAGADFIVSIDVLSKSKTDITKRPDIFNVVWQSFEIMINGRSRAVDEELSDFIIEPEIVDANPFDLTIREKLIQKGEEAALEVIEEIKQKAEETESLGGRIKRFFNKN